MLAVRRELDEPGEKKEKERSRNSDDNAHGKQLQVSCSQEELEERVRQVEKGSHSLQTTFFLFLFIVKYN